MICDALFKIIPRYTVFLHGQIIDHKVNEHANQNKAAIQLDLGQTLSKGPTSLLQYDKILLTSFIMKLRSQQLNFTLAHS